MYSDAAVDLKPQNDSANQLAHAILRLVLRYRRSPARGVAIHGESCTACAAPHLDRVMRAIERREPITFVLPAFPGKSPNPAKVLGTRPDMAERQSLTFLDSLTRRISAIYPPGARIVLCSDGRVFNDAVGIADRDITAYQQDLSEMISEIGATNLTCFNLDHIFRGLSFDAMRARLTNQYAESIDDLRATVRAGGDAERLYCGITRFLLEDATRPGLTMSRTALQKECRRRAYVVIQRSRAWDVLLAQCFPNAVRLSIHPQVCGSRKIGIHLMETEDEWLTAWHSVAVEIQGRFRLMKRDHVEKLGGELVRENGRPSHYRLAVAPEKESGK